MAEIQLILCHLIRQGGLRADVALLTEILSGQGHQVTLTKRPLPDAISLELNPMPYQSRRRFDLNIYIEHCGPEEFLQQHLEEARLHVFLPNPEWFSLEWLPCLKFADAVLCKTLDGYRIFEGLVGDKAVFTSFTSFDRYKETREKRRECFHGAGASTLKGTSLLVDLWEEAGDDLPPLHLYFSELLIAQRVVDLYTRRNIQKFLGSWDDEAWQGIQNSYQFHLCPSRYEGFGHYLHEAKSTGAIVITTDAPPMNELIRPEFGILVPARATVAIEMATAHEVCKAALGQAIRHELSALLQDPDRLAEMSAKAREDFLKNDRLFRERFPTVIDGLLQH